MTQERTTTYETPDGGSHTTTTIVTDAPSRSRGAGMWLVAIVLLVAKPFATALVGSGTEVSGNFFTDMWGNNTSDIDVRAMLHGYATVAWTNEASYIPDATAVTVPRRSNSWSNFNRCSDGSMASA